MIGFPSVRYKGVLIVLLSIGLLKACKSIPPEYDAFFAQTPERQREEAKGFSVEKQIEFYLAGTRYIHPPSSTLLCVIAESGNEAIRTIVAAMPPDVRRGCA